LVVLHRIPFFGNEVDYLLQTAAHSIELRLSFLKLAACRKERRRGNHRSCLDYVIR
jgi:hypothetical protein